MVGMHAARCTNLAARGVRPADRPRHPLRRPRDRQGGGVLPARAASCTSTSTRASSARSSSPTLGDRRRRRRRAARAARRCVTPDARPAWTRARRGAPRGASARDARRRRSAASRTASSATPPRSSGPDAIVTSDVGQHQMWVAQAFPFTRPRQWLTSGGLGTMGFGLPAAIGAALALPDRRVVCFTGDGSLLMNLQELATAAEEQRRRQGRSCSTTRTSGWCASSSSSSTAGATTPRASTPSPTSRPSRAASASQRVRPRARPRSRTPRWRARSASPGPCLVNVPIARRRQRLSRWCRRARQPRDDRRREPCKLQPDRPSCALLVRNHPGRDVPRVRAVRAARLQRRGHSLRARSTTARAARSSCWSHDDARIEQIVRPAPQAGGRHGRPPRSGGAGQLRRGRTLRAAGRSPPMTETAQVFWMPSAAAVSRSAASSCSLTSVPPKPRKPPSFDALATRVDTSRSQRL